MEKIIAAFDARRQLGKILQDVSGKGDKFVVERHGEEVAAIVPMEVYREWKREREAFFDKMRAASERSGLLPTEADALAQEAVQAVRSANKMK